MRTVRALVLLTTLATAVSAHALPFNDDMVDVQKRAGSMMRSKVPGTVAIGFGESHLANKDEAKKLQNPIKGDPISTANGQRLFRVNCYPCHGDISKTPHTPGPASVNSGGIIPSMDLSLKTYTQKISEAMDYSQDGYIYATIHFGGALMPALGWKLSPTEHWDIVNYVRKVQRDKNPDVPKS